MGSLNIKLSGAEQYPPKDVHVPILETCEFNSIRQMGLCRFDLVKDLEMGRNCPELSKCV